MSILEVKNVSKKYIVAHEKEALIKSVLPAFFRSAHKEEFWALKDVSFGLKDNESLGVIGFNGAGKTTLLNLIAGISGPTSGSIKTNGKVSAFLTLGAGFHQELTGEENIFLNGTILGMSTAEIRKKFRSMVDFSELGSFIDAPLQTYSAGMMMRLGFSVAIHVDFDILVMDEILSVGDLYFQNKCVDRIKEFRKMGKTLIVSSQSLELVEALTDNVLLLEKGKILSFGLSRAVINDYKNLVSSTSRAFETKDLENVIEERKVFEQPERIRAKWGERYGSKEVEITKVKISGTNGREKRRFNRTQDIKIEAHFKVNKEVFNPHLGAAIFREDAVYCCGPNTDYDGIKIEKMEKGESRFSIVYRDVPLLPGRYLVSVAIWDKDEENPYDYHCAFYEFFIKGKNPEGALYREDYKTEKILVDSKSPDNGCGIMLKNRFNETTNVFKTNEPLYLFFEFPSRRLVSCISLKVYKDAGLLCFTLKALVIKKARHRLKFTIPELTLLAGRYYVTLEDGTKIGEFKVVSEKRDHGVVSLKHVWNTEA